MMSNKLGILQSRAARADLVQQQHQQNVLVPANREKHNPRGCTMRQHTESMGKERLRQQCSPQGWRQASYALQTPHPRGRNAQHQAPIYTCSKE